MNGATIIGTGAGVDDGRCDHRQGQQENESDHDSLLA
jgi:hypothetical protein